MVIVFDCKGLSETRGDTSAYGLYGSPWKVCRYAHMDVHRERTSGGPNMLFYGSA